MKTSHKIQTGVLVAALALAGGVTATAQQSQGHEPAVSEKPIKANFRDRKQRRSGHGGPRGQMLQDIFKLVDADSDGAVTQAEIDAFRAAKTAQADISGDGALSIEEFDTLYREFTRPRMVDAFQHMDNDGDGLISQDEMDARFGSIVARMDHDEDGVLTLKRRHRSD